jgi:tetratricopeptide (TPR) repeat protein
MAGGKSLRIGLITGAVAVTAFIYLLPKTPQGTKESPAVDTRTTTPSAFSIQDHLSSARKELRADTASQLLVWEKAIENPQSEVAIYDSIARIWDVRGESGLAAWYFEQKAGRSGAEQDWLGASYRFFDAFKNTRDSLQAAHYSGKAVECYTRVLELNPKNLNAKTDLALIYAESSTEPMKGIMMLREVVAENPEHENAQLNLGFLSMKSGQFEKAIERFNKVLEINPGRIEMHLYNGEAYLRQGNKEKAVEQFNIFRNLSNDSEMIREVDEYLEKIKTAS